jgi:Holliday junction resolvase-like predicted endonuclease
MFGAWHVCLPRRQADLRELSAMDWLESQGYGVWLPIGRSPDCDVIADDGERLHRVQVKTTTYRRGDRRVVAICTRAGNRWNGVVKRFSVTRCDWLFVLVADCRRSSLRPLSRVARTCSSAVRSAPNLKLLPAVRCRWASQADRYARRVSAGFPSGQRGSAVNRLALPSQVRILPPPPLL